MTLFKSKKKSTVIRKKTAKKSAEKRKTAVAANQTYTGKRKVAKRRTTISRVKSAALKLVKSASPKNKKAALKAIAASL